MQHDKTLAVDAPLSWDVNASTVFQGTAFPLKFWRAKNVQKSVRFTTTFSLNANIVGTNKDSDVTLMPGKFYLLHQIFPQSDLGRRANSRWALPQIFSFIYFPRDISKTRGPTNVKFCTMVSTRPSFIMNFKKFRGAHSKKFQGLQTCKIWPYFGRL